MTVAIRAFPAGNDPSHHPKTKGWRFRSVESYLSDGKMRTSGEIQAATGLTGREIGRVLKDGTQYRRHPGGFYSARCWA